MLRLSMYRSHNLAQVTRPNSTDTVLPLRALSAALTSALVLAAVGWDASAFAQEGCGVPPVLNSVGVQDFPLPLDATGMMTFTAKGGDGGDAILLFETMAGPVEQCRSNGGKGAEVTASFNIGTGAGELEPGGTLRFIVGAAGQTGTTTLNFFGSGSDFGGGGGGSAVLFRAPGMTGNTCNDWTTLIVAGGGGGAHQGATLLDCGPGQTGGNGRTTTSGGNGDSGGTGGTNGNGGGGGHNDTGGGGGAFGSGSGTANGSPGCPNGGSGGNSDSNGGFGYGGGGGGEGAGGGGGGYSGGGGGGQNQEGGGGGSFAASFAINPTFRVSSQSTDKGRIDWSATPNFFVNDFCETAIPIGDGFYEGCTDSATRSIPNDADCTGAFDVWYAYTNDSDCSREVTATMFDDVPDIFDPDIYNAASISVYRNCGNANTITCDQSSFDGDFGTVTWNVPAGATHYIAVQGRTGSRGLFRLDVTSRDRLTNTLVAPATEFNDTTNAGASGLSSCFGSLNSPDRTYIYFNQSGVPEEVTASTCNGSTEFDTVISIHEECSGVQIVCASDTCGDGTEVTWTAEPDVRYIIRVAGENEATGFFRLDVTASPVNDSCDNPIPLSGYMEFSGLLTTASASGIGGGCAGTDLEDLWFSYTHPDPNGCLKFVKFEVDEFVNYQKFNACNPGNPSCLSRNNEHFFVVEPGQTILFRVSGQVFSPEFAPAYAFTFDDGTELNSSGTLQGVPGTINFTLRDQADTFFPLPSCGDTAGKGSSSRLVFNRLGYPVRVTASTCGVGLVDTVLHAALFNPIEIDQDYNACEYQELACNDNSPNCGPTSINSQVTVEIPPDGQAYYFITRKNNSGEFQAFLDTHLEESLPPLNDTCASAQEITDSTVFGVVDTATASGTSASCAPTTGGDLWYRYTNTSACDLRVTASLCNDEAGFETVLTAFDACNGTELACELPANGCLGGSTMTWIIPPGDTSLIRVATLSTSMVEGRFRLDVSSEEIDPFGFGLPGDACSARNDLCTNAITMGDGLALGTLANATHDLNPSCASGGEQLPDVWYSYTNQAACTAEVTVSTCFFGEADIFRSLAVFDACGGSEIVCDSGSTDPNDQSCATVTWNMAPGVTNLIRVSRTQGIAEVDEFTLTVTSIGAGDRDEDGVEDACDNCLDDANTNQADTDNDGNGDACDACPGFDDNADADNDTVADGCDACPGFDDFADADNDTVADACDQCPGFDDLADVDGDGVADACDPCPNDNPDDVDGNGTCGGQVVISGALVPGVTITDALTPPGPLPNLACANNRPETYDFWTFDATAGDSIALEIDRLAAYPNPRFSIWLGNLEGAPLDEFTSPNTNPNQSIIASANNEELTPFSGPGGDPAIFGLIAPATGTYTVLVSGNCNAPLDDNLYTIRLEFAVEATIRNVTRQTSHLTIQQALDNAENGNLIEISEGYVFEDGIVFPNAIDVTLQGAGPGRTIIDAENLSGAVPLIQIANTGQTSATVIRDLTIQKDSDQSQQLGALWIENASPRIENVTFQDNLGRLLAGGGIDVTVSGAASNVVLERCRFVDARGGSYNVGTFDDAKITLINCAFDQSRRLIDDGLITSLSFIGGTANVINCTVGGPLEELGATVNVVNSAFLMQPPLGGGVTLTRSLYPGATGDSIDGVPTFIDETNNDLRLADGSLGIDAADYDAYIAAGGSNVDAGGQARTFDDPNTVDIGIGVLSYLDIGAYEFFIDSDGDGVGDGSDICPGFDDAIDTDNDGTPDGCDACPDDFFDDQDNDTVCDSDDMCPFFDDTIDTDGDTIPDCLEPIGDECAFALAVSNETIVGSLQGYSGGTGNDDSCATQNTIDQWFRYDSSVTGTLTITTCNPGTEFNTVLSAFDGCPEAGGQELACNNNAPVALPECQLGGLNRFSTITLPVSIGNSYYVRLSVRGDDFADSGGTGMGYEITFLAEGDGEECNVARFVSAGINFGTMADNTGSSGDDDSCGDFNVIDEWLFYTAPVSGQVIFSTCDPNTGFNTILSLFDNCPAGGGVELACNDNVPEEPVCDLDGFPGYSQIEWTVSAGTTYYLRLSALFDVFEPNGPGFVLTIQEPGDCNGDGHRDFADFESFAGCLSGVDVPAISGCDCTDFDSDGDNDMVDFLSLQQVYGL